MKNTFIKIHTLPWAMTILVACLTFIGVVKAETEEHSHEQEMAVKKEKSHEEHESHENIKTDEGSHDEHGEEGNRKVGEGKAVVGIHDQKGFRLSSQAYVALGIEHLKVNGSSFAIPKMALVRIKNTTGVYRYKDHFFKLIPVKIKSEEKNQYIVTSAINEGELIVTQGMELLRVADIYVQDTSDYSHGH